MVPSLPLPSPSQFHSSMGLIDLGQPSDMRHCISDSNLLELEEEAQMMWVRPSNAGSEAQLNCIGDFTKDVFNSLPVAILDKRTAGLDPPCSNIFDLGEGKPAAVVPTVPTIAVPEPAKPVQQDLELQKGVSRRSRSSTDWQPSESKLPPVLEPGDVLPAPEAKKRPGSVTRRPPRDRGPYVSRYRPGVPVLKGPYRDSIIQVELQKRENDFCQWNRLR